MQCQQNAIIIKQPELLPLSQAAQQGLAVLMATAKVLLKHETSTTYQSHIYESIDLHGAPPGGEITMTSYPACNKTSLSRKPCIADKKLPWIAIRKSWSLLQNSSWKIA